MRERTREENERETKEDESLQAKEEKSATIEGGKEREGVH